MNSTTEQLRIIGGQWRSRVIRFDNIKGLRPTPSRIRETLFNWLQPYLVGARCLDLFAGSGVLGFEALSRGAQYTLFIDNQKKVVARLKQNANLLNTQDCKSIVATIPKNIPLDSTLFDIIFLDPPYEENLIAPCFNTILENTLLKPHGLIYFEHEKQLDIDYESFGFTVLKIKSTKRIQYGLLQKN